MVMRRWDPFNEMRQMQETMNRLWRGFGSGSEGQEMETWSVPLDVMQEGDNIIVCASMPGVNPDNIDISIEDNVLTIKGHSKLESEHQEGNYLMRERRSGSFHRALRLPDTVDTDNIQCSYENGVLTINVPKAESKKARQLKVNFGGEGLQGAPSQAPEGAITDDFQAQGTEGQQGMDQGTGASGTRQRMSQGTGPSGAQNPEATRRR